MLRRPIRNRTEENGVVERESTPAGEPALGPRRILVGVDPETADRSAAGLEALRWAQRLATQSLGTHAGVQLIVASALGKPVHGLTASEHDRMVEAHRVRIEARLGNAIRLTAPAVGRELLVFDEDPRKGLLRAARQNNAGLIVIGVSRGAGLFHVGSVGEYLAHHVDRPLAVVRAMPEPTLRTIVLGVDGSAAGSAAARWCSAHASISGASIRAVHLEGARAGAKVLEEADRYEAGLVVVPLAGRLDRIRVRSGGPAFTVLHHAERSVVLVPAAGSDSKS